MSVNKKDSVQSGDAVQYMAIDSNPAQQNAERIRCSADAHKIVNNEMRMSERFQEHIVIMYLNSKNEVLKSKIVAIGTVSEALVSPADVLRTAILLRGCARLIMVHNHPSGDPTPSAQDMQLTHRMSDAVKLLGYELLDHLIIGRDDLYISLKDSGKF